jgi:L-alanine-DL-glutamate epimerase-like enolase superfamily enzyme
MKLDRIELFPLCYPFIGTWKFLDGFPGHTVVLVKATADDGSCGWGQSMAVPRWSCETLETVLVVLRKYFAPAVVGLDPLDLEAAQQALDRTLAPAFSTGMPLARAGLDMALHDLAGKLTGRSLAELWGRPTGGPITLSWTVTSVSLDAAEAELATARQRGYRNFNLKVGSDPAFDVQLATLVRRLVPDGFLWADANGGYDVATALDVAPRLADAGVDVLEAPLRPNRISGYQALRRQHALPITMDEGLVSPVEVEEFIRLGMVDGITIKPSRAGGLESARRQIEIALDAGLFFLGSGLTDPDVALAASLALYSSYGLAKPAALNGPQFLPSDILAAPLPIVGDQARVPAGPGLGITVDEAKVQPLLVEPSFEG